MIDQHNSGDLLIRFSGIEIYKLKEIFDKFRQVDIKNFVLMVLKVINIDYDKLLFLAIQAKHLFQKITTYKQIKAIKFSSKNIFRKFNSIRFYELFL